MTVRIAFLFAVARGAQRNYTHRVAEGPRMSVSIRCREGRTAEHGARWGSLRVEGFLFAVARGVQRNVVLSLTLISLAVIISIRCREGRTAELGLPKAPTYADAFLFAVARGVQRNR